MKLSNSVIIHNVKDCPVSHDKYLKQRGTVRIIDNITTNDKVLFGVEFLNDTSINANYYCDCKQNGIAPLRPHIIFFNETNLMVV